MVSYLKVISRPMLCLVYSLAPLPTDTARVFFLSHFLEKKGLFLSSSTLVPVQCLVKTLSYLIFPQSRKILC